MASAVCAAVASGVGGYVWYEGQRQPLLEIYVFALKSGQAVFVRTPSDKRILIDGGTNSEIIRHLSAILPFYSRNIDKIVATKADGTHVSGLIDVLERYSVGEVIVPGLGLEDIGAASSTDQIYKIFIDKANASGIPIKEVMAGDQIVLDDLSLISNVKSDVSVILDVIFPVAISGPISTTVFQYSKASSPELVTKISYGSTSVMLAGSITTKIQKYIAIDGSSSESSVLVLSQNATANNFAKDFIGQVAPDYIVYSAALASASAPASVEIKKSSKDLKEKPDPLASIPMDHRINIKEAGTLKIVSDGREIILSPQ